MEDNRPTIAERQEAKRLARRAAKGLPPYTLRAVPGTRKTRRHGPSNRIADRIDGYDRDDLGHSPDY